MLRRLTTAVLVLLLAFSMQHAGLARGEALLKDGERVLLLGNTFIERDQQYGYLETALASRFNGTNVTFRNLGWSGDTVFGHARARFGSVSDGFKHLQEHVLAEKPTLILLCYGANEAHGGEAGLLAFFDGLDKLLAVLDRTGARIVILSPLKQERLPPPLPDPTEHNKNVRLYCDAIAQVAAARNAPFVDLFELLGDADPPLTDNGIHLTPYGYWRAATAIERGLNLSPRVWKCELDAATGAVASEGVAVSQLVAKGQSASFQTLDAMLPTPPAPRFSPDSALQHAEARVLKVRGLAAGRYVLSIDGEEILTSDAQTLAAGVRLTKGPEFDQAEALRSALYRKNELYFHRWRPQNETYLFLFRKHEQGNNAVEIPAFDPLVAEQEAAARALAAPQARRYELKRVTEK